MSSTEENETKLMLTAILEQLQIRGAKIEAMNHNLLTFQREFNTFRDEMTGFRNEMNGFRAETAKRFDNIDQTLDYVAEKLGKHDKDIHLIKLKSL